MSQQTFQSIINKFKSKTEYERHLQQSERSYQLKVYRVGSMSRQQALNSYKQLQTKYQNGIYQRLSTGWYENQRRLFVWFMVCYSKWHNIDTNQQPVWQELAEIFFNKDPKLLKYQFMNVLKRQGRVKWSQQQDQLLRAAYTRHEIGQWNQIAKQLFFSFPQGKSFKTPKNCRQRWNNHLNSEVKKQAFTEQEDRELLMKIKQKGKKWSQIAKQMQNKRTQHQIKNRYNSMITHYFRSNSKIESLKQISKIDVNSGSMVKDQQAGEEEILQSLLRQLQSKLSSQSMIMGQYSQCLITGQSTTTITTPIINNITVNNNNSRFPFLNTINVINQSSFQHSSQKDYHPLFTTQNNNHNNNNNNNNNSSFLNPNNLSASYPIVLKPSFESNFSQQQKKQYTTSGGMTLIYCGTKNNTLDKSMTAAIEDKLFGTGSQWLSSQNKSDHFWMERPVHHTPGGFFQDSSYNQKKMGEFKLSQKGSFQKSQIAASMEFFKLPRSDMSQQYRILTSSTNTDPRVSASMNYQFSNDIKQL